MKKMTTLFNASLLGLAFIFLAASCGGTKPLATVPQEVGGSHAAREQALLWEITSNGLKEKSYLFGTMHMIPEEDYFMPEYVQRSLKVAKHVYFEVDMEEMSDMSGMMGMMGALFLDKGMTIKDLYSEEDYLKVKEKLAEIPMLTMLGDYAERMKPFFLSMLIEQSEGMGADLTGGGMGAGIKSYEMELTDMAKEASKPVSGLETLEFQIGLFDKIPLEEQAQMLLDALTAEDNGGGSSEDQMALMVKMYTQQDVPGLHKMVLEQSKDSKDFEDKLLNERNENWIPLMDGQMKKESTFFAVGAAHLGGEKGVVSLLRKQGYIVNPVLK